MASLPPRPPGKSTPAVPRPHKRNRYQLKRDILSHFYDKHGKNRVYGRAGETVTEISRSIDVLIVEGKSGDRYPARIENLIRIGSDVEQR